MSSLGKKLSALALGTAIAAIGVLAVVLSTCSSTDVDPVWLLAQSKLSAARSDADEHRELVLAELANTREEWAGSYAWSNGYERRKLDLAPCGFFYEYDHCTGTGDLAYGAVANVDDTRIRLKPTARVEIDVPERLEPTRRAPFRFEDELYSIPWSGERFLVPASQMAEFCALAKAPRFNAMRYADYPRKMRDGQARMWDLELHGLPEVPPEFRSLLPSDQ